MLGPTVLLNWVAKICVMLKRSSLTAAAVPDEHYNYLIIELGTDHEVSAPLTT